MIKYIKKLIKKQRLLKKYKKGEQVELDALTANNFKRTGDVK